jgi:hypothetical protein
MTLQIVKPYIHVEDANGNPYIGAKLYVYVPGTTTPAAIYADAALSIPLANPLTGSDAAGNFPRAYIAAGAYKLRAETAAGVLIWQEDNIDTGLSAGSGALPIASGGTGGITVAAARTNLDVPSNSELSAVASSISTIQASLQNIVSTPQGYLTLTSGVAILLSTVAAATAVYYTPFKGNLIPIYDGSQFNTTAFSELTLTLNSNHVASNIYDVFVFGNNGSATLGTGPAWNTATAGAGARGIGAGTTELDLSKGGLLTNKWSMTARNGATTYTVNANQGTYVGSLFMDGMNGQVTCHRDYGQLRRWGIWNAFNRVPIILQAGAATGSWTYNTATWRPSNNDANNNVSAFTGLAEEEIAIDFLQSIQLQDSNTTSKANNGIGVNSTTATGGKIGDAKSSLGVVGLFTQERDIHAKLLQLPALGVNTFQCLENGNASNSALFFGTSASMMLTAQYRG